MPTKCQHIREDPSLADAPPLDADRSCTDDQHIPTHPLAVYPQYVHFGSGGTPVRFEPLMPAPSSDGFISGTLQSAFSAPTAMVPSQPLQQQTVSHVLLPVVSSSSQWQQSTCRWVMPSIQQETTTWIIQSPVAAAQRPGEGGLCHPSQASCCQHPSQLGPLHPGGDTGCFSSSQRDRAKYKDKSINQASTAKNVESNTPSTMNPRPDFAGVSKCVPSSNKTVC